MYATSSELNKIFLKICYELSDDKRNKMDPKYDPKILFFEGYE